ncbi:MAG: glycoside hydrolase family 3 C-terminal domain-containing protein [Bacilli bacterium]|nr:glycoside hydrolase family 3 C-terminal domain-containing protein [Bacilli bacterium]
MAKRSEKAKRLTLSEKIRLMYGEKAWTIHGVPRIGIPPVRVSDGPSGLRYMPNDVMEVGSDATTKDSIAYPCSALAACSFDLDLMEEYGRMLGLECKSAGVDVVLGPGINIKRNPLCGRNFEYYSEDPYLSGMLAASFTKGTQSVGVGACLKHFACNSQESYRMVNNSIVDERTLHEIYLRAFQIAIDECSPWAIMASYNKINGTYACESKSLLLDTLKNGWHYSGVVLSDWGAVNDPILCHENGLDVEMPCFVNRQGLLFLAADRRVIVGKEGKTGKEPKTVHRLSKKRINDITDRVLRLSERTHAPHKLPAFDLNDGKAHQLAVKIAESSMILTKNNGILPLESVKGLAVLGELAANPRLGGGGSSQVKGFAPKSFLQRCIEAVGEGNVHYSRGYDLATREFDSDDENAAELIVDAVDVATRCPNVILFLGTSPEQESEGFDRLSLRLPDNQVELYRRVVERNPNAIVVIATGGPVEVAFAETSAAEILSYFPGEGGGEALYNIITGATNPSGHLAETWPKRNYETPSFGFYPGDQAQSLYREGIYVGYRYYVSAEEEKAVRFPFGYGLSYTQFAFENLRVSSKKPANLEETPLKVKVSIKNNTKVGGAALVQVYVRPLEGNVFKAKRTLQAFKKVYVDGNRRVEVELELSRRAFEHYDTESGSFLVEGGKYAIEIGQTCMDKDIVLSGEVEIPGDKEFPSLRTELTVYYKPPKDGFWLYDDVYEKLLGYKVPFPDDPRARPYTLNSTIENIRNTWIGRILVRRAQEVTGIEDEKNPLYRSMLQTPIRNVVMNGISDKVAQAIVDCANGRLILALWHLMFRKG